MQDRNLSSEIRLNRYLAQCGLGSRRECDRIITGGTVKVNGEKIITLGTKITPGRDLVEHGGKVVKVIEEKSYLAYHKSRGTIVTAKDPQGRDTIYDALKKSGIAADHLKYVGRLDRNSEGLLLLTNDGDIIHALTHPRFHIKKVYQMKIDKELRQEDASVMVQKGVASEGQMLQAGAIRKIDKKLKSDRYWYDIDLYEGKNRQIRRMFESLGYEIIRLKRTQFGGIKLRDLKRGSYRFLAEREIQGLKSKGYRKHKS